MTEDAKDRESTPSGAPDQSPTEQLPAQSVPQAGGPQAGARPPWARPLTQQSGAAPQPGPPSDPMQPGSIQQSGSWAASGPPQSGPMPQSGAAPGPEQGASPQYGPPNHPTQPFPGPEYAPMSFDPLAPPPGAAFGAQPPRRPVRSVLVAGAVALALLSGGVGGAVGALVTRDDHRAPVTNALDAPGPNISNTSAAPAGSVQAVAQKVLPSVVTIKVAGNRGEGGEGSGVVLSSDGLILTNNHVASGAGGNAKMAVVFSDGTSAGANLVGADPVSDLAVIRVAGRTNLTPIELGSSGNLQVGQSVVAVGAPLGLSGTVTTGIVSALNRPVSTQGEGGPQNPAANPVIDAIQTDAAINPGNSGGALVDGSGKLIGINTAIATMGSGDTGAQQSGSIGLGFAIPVDQARRVADQLIKSGHATYAQLGVTVARTPEGAQQVAGALVRDVAPDSPAAKAGIPAGSVVTRLDNRPIDSGNALTAGVRSHQPGDKVKITYTDGQGNNPKTVEVTLAGAPADGGR
ncbi:PDZ domain-containing protein [Nocardia panacis]|uniref:PDZ domain-containing protein n=1 Tax=Nocardia panacis TaxID=2340916 RepID=A0A3A4KM39_9NOCA|nr:trypsin-like peptidase domain-containing protein [Nocardia panacis]RJO76397.1 PDZ domain-containing protein [Nocardia panacis]